MSRRRPRRRRRRDLGPAGARIQRRHVQGDLEGPQVLAPPDADRTEPHRVIVDDLAVEQHGADAIELGHKVGEGDLRCVGHAIKHRLSGEKTAELYAVQTAGELAVLPDLDAVCVTEAVQLAVGLHESVRDPDPVVPMGRGAPAHHRLEGGIEGHVQTPLAQDPAEPSRQPDAVAQKNRPRVGRIPAHRVLRPGKDASGVGIEQQVDVEPVGDGYEAGRIRQARIGKHRSPWMLHELYIVSRALLW